jgi:hypothetical protein
MVRLSASGGPEGAALLWRWDRTKLDGGRFGSQLWLTGPPGRHTVEVIAIRLDKDGNTTAEEAFATIVIGDGEPLPPPRPPTPKDPESPPPGRPGKVDPRAALCQLRVGRSGCTATIIGPRRADGKWDVLTASHCLNSASSGTITLSDKRTLKVTKTAQDPRADLCWMVTDDANLDELPHAMLATEHPPAGTAIWHQGFGVDRPGNREEGFVRSAPGSDGKFRMRLSVSSGDSGGGIFRADTGEWVSCVCCTISPSPPDGNTYGGSVVRARAIRPVATRSDSGCNGIHHPILVLEEDHEP